MREELIKKLAFEMRYAENYYLDTFDDSKKSKVMNKVDKLLTPPERQEFEAWCESLAI